MHMKMWDEINFPFPNVGWITYPFSNFNGCTVDVWEWISNFIVRFSMDANTYPCWDLSYTMLAKGAPEWKIYIVWTKLPVQERKAQSQSSGLCVAFSPKERWDLHSLKYLSTGKICELENKGALLRSK